MRNQFFNKAGNLLDLESKLGLDYIKSTKLNRFQISTIETSNVEFRELTESQLKRFEKANKILVGEGIDTSLVICNGKLIYKKGTAIKLYN